MRQDRFTHSISHVTIQICPHSVTHISNRQPSDMSNSSASMQTKRCCYATPARAVIKKHCVWTHLMLTIYLSPTFNLQATDLWPVFTAQLNYESHCQSFSQTWWITHHHMLIHVFLWSPYVIGQTIIFSCCDLFFFSSPNLSGRRLDVYHTSTHGVALV